MIRSRTSFFGLFFLLLCAGCVLEQDKKVPPKQNLCHYSKYLHISKLTNGFDIQISNPDFPMQKIRIVVTRPYQRIALMSATHVGMMAAIQQQAKICAVSDAKYVHDPKVIGWVKKNKIQDLKAELGLSAFKMLQSRPQIVVYSGFGNEKEQLKRLHSSKIVYIPNYEWREKTPLARAEWVLFFGVLSGEFEKAQGYFSDVEKKYLGLKKRIHNNDQCNQHKVLISGNLYGDQWIAPAGQSFEARLYRDAGLAYVFSAEKGTGSIFKSLAEIIRKGTVANIWLNPGLSSRSKILRQYPKAKFFPFFKQPIYCYTSNTNKYWELAAVHPDWLLSDLNEIAMGKPKKMHFYSLLE
jgi:iron complex transport system substrate-binding protein